MARTAIKHLAATGLRRGLVDGSRGWLAVGLAAGSLRVAKRLWARQPVTERFDLRPGETLEIRHLDREP